MRRYRNVAFWTCFLSAGAVLAVAGCMLAEGRLALSAPTWLAGVSADAAADVLCCLALPAVVAMGACGLAYLRRISLVAGGRRA